MKSKSADNVIHAYIETILPQIAPSRFILTDNGTEFKNDTMNNVLIRLNTEHKFTTVYFPRGNSRLENSHALLKRSISKYIDLLDVEWDRCLNLATYVFNISPSSDNCSSPYYIVYGKEPIDAELKELEEVYRYKLWIKAPTTVSQDLEDKLESTEQEKGISMLKHYQSIRWVYKS